MRLFLDSSALSKRYILEPGSKQVSDACQKADEVNLSLIAIPETLSALNRLRRESKLTEKQYGSLKRDFLGDVKEAILIQVTSSVIERAVRYLENHPLRTLDAIQLASAAESLCDQFLTGDLRQYEVGQKINLKVHYVE